jgi:transketolase
MRNEFAESLFKLAWNDERIYIVVADISPAGPMKEFQKKFPERFINVGVAEQSMIGVAAGLALKGALPFTYTIATFALYRPFEFIRDDLAYQKLPVTVVGIGGGVIYSTLGATHYAQEDISVATTIPGLNVLAPSTPNEVTEILQNIVEGRITGPSYLRLGKTGEKNFDFQDSYELGKPRKAISSNSKLCILSYGVLANKIFNDIQESDPLRGRVDFLTLPTIKPINEQSLLEILSSYETIIVAEENSIIGSIGQCLKALAYQFQKSVKIIHYALKDEFVHCYGTHEDILEAHGLSTKIIMNEAIRQLKLSKQL